MAKNAFLKIAPVSSINKSDRHDIAEILLKVALNTIKQTTKYYTYLGVSALFLLSQRGIYIPTDNNMCMLD
jgi:hypothetical protein